VGSSYIGVIDEWYRGITRTMKYSIETTLTGARRQIKDSALQRSSPGRRQNPATPHSPLYPEEAGPHGKG
jgi:hypothetical protein